MADPAPEQRSRWPAVLVFLAVGATAATYAATADVTYLAETWTHTVAARGIDGIADLFDPGRVPLRPFQHAWFWGMETLWPVDPALARLPGFLAHLASLALTASLARRLGAGRGAAALAMLAFAVFPDAKSLAYVAAVGWPFRVLATLVGLHALLAHTGRPRPATGALLVTSFLFGLACNQGAVVFPALAGLVLLGHRGRTALRLLRDPWVLACLVLAVAYALYVGVLHERSVHNVVSSGSLLANGARAGLCLAPEILRAPVIGSLRAGGAGALVGIGIMAVLAGGVAVWLIRSTPAVRALLLCLPIEWAPAMAVTGFAQRYAYLSAALFALALALTWQRTRGTARTVASAVLALLLAAWSLDTAVDVHELRTAGRKVDAVLEAARDARARAAPGETVTLLDPPQSTGNEDDLFVFNHGLREALELRGIPGPWHTVATAGAPWWPLVTEEPREDILHRLRRSGPPYVAFDPATGTVEESR